MTDGVRGTSLTTALQALSRDQRVTTPLRQLVADVLPDNWRVVGHHVKLVAEVVVLRDGDSDAWGVFVLPTPLRLSTREEVAVQPIPFDKLDPEGRARVLAGGADVRVGT